jgi:curli biogenesis system outer membrane secretion channel CsgG
MKRWYTIGLLLVVVVLAAAMLVACSEKETTTTAAPTTEAAETTEVTEATETTEVAEPTETTAAATAEIGVYFEDQGNNVVLVMDVPAPGMSFPVHSLPADDYAATIEAFDADGNSLGNLDLPEEAAGALDYSSVADTAAKIVVTTFSGVAYEYLIP